MTKTKRGFKACVISLLLVLLMLALIPATIAKAETLGDGIDVSTSENTYCYLKMNVKDTSMYIPFKATGIFKALGGSYWVRSDITATLILRFAEVTDKKGNPLLVTANVKLSRPATWSTSSEFVFLEDIKVNLRKEYYADFKAHESKINNYTVLLFNTFDSCKMFSKDCSTKYPPNDSYYNFNSIGSVFTTDELDDDANVDNGGVDTNGQNNQSFFEKFFNWLKGIFNWNISYKTFQRICIITVAVIIALIILSFIFKRKK